ncbi:uncharacterized protein LOC128963056 [Oppia nitens]|uniref:uncharacterized protein LOC128963056 n=1 Tax=Oppia nitens TaxID=1686743 RepID=UPI0023DA8AC3|nr:uncharacterized protein LOC128963056 [Oppia nitens]XP_054165488.1 uncharacterized protein LOC128963056 [Oppia nitens]
MSSNVLKSITDCYNFSDESKTKKTKTRRPTVATNECIRKLSTKPSNETKREGKWRCDVMRDTLSTAQWLNGVRAQHDHTIDTVLKQLINHTIDGCNCVNICSVHLLIGNTYLERFLLTLKEFDDKVVTQEVKCNDLNNICKDNPFSINDIPVQKESKCESNVMPELVNMKSMTNLLAPIDSAVDHWTQALDFGIKMKNYMNEELIIGLKIYYNLYSVIQINAFYKRFESRLKSIHLLNKFCEHFSNKYSEMSLTANYFLVKTYLDLGETNRANAILIRNKSSNNCGQPNNETFATSLNFLAKCELDLKRGYTERAAKMLCTFLSSDYVKKLTINRYYIKGLALLLATHFPSKHFNYDQYLREFIEPTSIAICILKRWHKCLTSSNKSNDENIINVGDVDPIWYRFSVLNFAFDAIQMSLKFYQNIEMPLDAIYSYNCLLKVGRRCCATVRVAELLISGSQLDNLCDHKYASQLKLKNAMLCISHNRWSSDDESVFDSGSSISTISPDTKRAIHGHIPKKQSLIDNIFTKEVITIDSSNSDLSDNEDCHHTGLRPLWEVKKKLRQLDNKYSDDSEDFLNDNKRVTLTEELLNESDYENQIIDLFLTKLEIKFNELLTDEMDMKTPNYTFSQVSALLVHIEKYASNVMKPIIIKHISDCKIQEIETNYVKYKLLKMQFIETLARLQIQMKEFVNVINTCSHLTQLKTFAYEERCIQSKLLYYEAFAKFSLFITNCNTNKANNVWLEYNSHFINELISSSLITINKSSTPPSITKSDIKTSRKVPNAPKQKQFKDKDIGDYVSELNYEDNNSDDDNNNDKNVSKLKACMRLNFERDCEVRSHSMTDLVSNDSQDIVVIDVIPKVESNSKTTQRITRSKTNLMKSSVRLSDNEDNVEKKTKRSYNKSTKTNVFINDVSNNINSVDKDIEELDDVFNKKLVINEEIGLKETVRKQTDIELIISTLQCVYDLIGLHPICKLYILVNKLLTDIYSLDKLKNEDKVGYHFCEMNAITYRYRNLFIAERKRKLNKLFKYDVNSLSFDKLMVSGNNSYKVYTDSLPNDWRVIQITAINNDSNIPNLIVCRYQKSRKPVFLKIKADPQKIIKHFMTHFMEIIEKSNASIANKDKETFWRLRYSLDDEMKMLLKSVEDTWFGAFRGILLGQIQDKRYLKTCQLLCTYIRDLMKNQGLDCKNTALLEVVVESLPILRYSEFRSAIKLLFNMPSDSIISKCYQKYEQLINDIFPIDNKEMIYSTYNISPVGIILDKSLEAFPFESLPSLETYNQSVFRTPSLRVLSLMYKAFKNNIYANGLNESSVYYVVNPADNLAKTQNYFKETFDAMKEWKGVIGEVPQSLQLKTAFESKDVYIFFGHGAGASYYRSVPDGLDSCNINCAAIVMGCSSGKLFSDGYKLETHGTPYRFIMNGCPCYVGVLWDVTDVDIDKFSDHMLSYCFTKWKPELNNLNTNKSITTGVSMSRKYCKLKYLIGAAPVVYGLPLFAKCSSN